MRQVNESCQARVGWNHVARGGQFLAVITVLSSALGCHLDGRTRRADRLLSELAPPLHLGQSLADARRAIPGLDVRHPGDSSSMYTATDSEPPRPVALIVWPRPAQGEHAVPGATVEGVELVMSPAVAAAVRKQVVDVFGPPTESTCAGPMIAQTDLVLLWNVGSRGGALLTIPERRPDGVAATARLFIYSGGWEPAQSISGYGTATCSVSS